jgi:hypothetical protein
MDFAGILEQSRSVVIVFEGGGATFQISQNGAALTAPTDNTVTSLGGGLSSVNLSATDTATLGSLIIRTNTGVIVATQIRNLYDELAKPLLKLFQTTLGEQLAAQTTTVNQTTTTLVRDWVGNELNRMAQQQLRRERDAVAGK